MATEKQMELAPTQEVPKGILKTRDPETGLLCWRDEKNNLVTEIDGDVYLVMPVQSANTAAEEEKQDGQPAS